MLASRGRLKQGECPQQFDSTRVLPLSAEEEGSVSPKGSPGQVVDIVEAHKRNWHTSAGRNWSCLSLPSSIWGLPSSATNKRHHPGRVVSPWSDKNVWFLHTSLVGEVKERLDLSLAKIGPKRNSAVYGPGQPTSREKWVFCALVVRARQNCPNAPHQLCSNSHQLRWAVESAKPRDTPTLVRAQRRYTITRQKNSFFLFLFLSLPTHQLHLRGSPDKKFNYSRW